VKGGLFNSKRSTAITLLERISKDYILFTCDTRSQCGVKNDTTNYQPSLESCAKVFQLLQDIELRAIQRRSQQPPPTWRTNVYSPQGLKELHAGEWGPLPAE
jgi:hypothetical protein